MDVREKENAQVRIACSMERGLSELVLYADEPWAHRLRDEVTDLFRADIEYAAADKAADETWDEAREKARDDIAEETKTELESLRKEVEKLREETMELRAWRRACTCGHIGSVEAPKAPRKPRAKAARAGKVSP